MSRPLPPALALAAALAFAAPAARAEGPEARCSATRVGRRVVVRSEALRFVDAELARLVRLGLTGRVEVELTLYRRRSVWFDARLAAPERLRQALTWEARTGALLLDGRPVPAEAGGEALLPLERVAFTLDADVREGEDLRVRVAVRLQVVTAQSLGRVAAWLTQRGRAAREAEEAGEEDGVRQGLVATVAEDLTRSAKGVCEVGPGG